jgi:hypothetical protein
MDAVPSIAAASASHDTKPDDARTDEKKRVPESGAAMADVERIKTRGENSRKDCAWEDAGLA